MNLLGLLLALCLPAVAGAGENAAPGRSVTSRAIDNLVFARCRQMGIQPAPLCSDAVFVRRVFLDVIGTLPTANEARSFLQDKTPNKRAVLIDRLLAREEFADYWAMKWSDLLRVKAEFPINLWPNAAQAYHAWIRSSLRDNLPYDQFARALLTASGSNFRAPPANFYRGVQNREPQGLARAVALAFMGTRAERWPEPELAGMAAFFSQVGYKTTSEWKEEIVFFDPSRWTNGLWRDARLPGGQAVILSPDRDPREIFADWLVDAQNPWFARSFVNRAWSWLLGRGIVQEPDDFRPDNPPSNPELLALLEREFIASGYNVRQLFRLILNSQTYQLDSVPGSDRPDAAAQFAFYPVRRLEAEVLIDALNQVTGATEKYSSPIPEPFTFMPDDQRAIALPDGSINSPFLELFGRSSRDTGLESERNNRMTSAQRLHLLNSSQVQRKIEQSPLVQSQLRGNKPQREILDALYLGILSRFPTEPERAAAAAYAQSAANRREATIDLAWALINSAEFLYRH